MHSYRSRNRNLALVIDVISKNRTRLSRNSNYRQFLEEICTNQRVRLTMTTNEGFLNQRQRYQSIKLPQDFSDEDRGREGY